MKKLSIMHSTVYRYSRPVVLNEHKLMVRPREGHQLKLISHKVSVSPHASLRWSQDVQGNTIGRATFEEPTDILQVDAHSVVELDSEPWPVFDIDASAISYPFLYSEHDLTDLGPMMTQHYPDPDSLLENWVRGFVRSVPTDTLSMLKDLSAGVSKAITYVARDAEGTQTPLQTLGVQRGSCRDFAVLLAEAARNLGFGSRIVSGYRYFGDTDEPRTGDNDSTHAWVEIFLPGAGWIAFDPTNNWVGNHNLIPVGVGGDIRQLAPVAGSFAGPSDALIKMKVGVQIKSYL